MRGVQSPLCVRRIAKDRECVIVDGHEDIAYNALNFGRDYRHSVAETRRLEAGGNHPNGICDRRAAGQPAGACRHRLRDDVHRAGATARLHVRTTPHYKTPAEANRLARSQFDHYQRLADQTDKIQLVRTQAELDAVLATWEPGTEDRRDHRRASSC